MLGRLNMQKHKSTLWFLLHPGYQGSLCACQGNPRKLPAGVIHTPKFLPGAHLTNLSSSPDVHLGSNINVRCYHSQLLIDPSIQRTTELSVDKQCPVGSPYQGVQLPWCLLGSVHHRSSMVIGYCSYHLNHQLPIQIFCICTFTRASLPVAILLTTKDFTDVILAIEDTFLDDVISDTTQHSTILYFSVSSGLGNIAQGGNPQQACHFKKRRA